MNSDLITLFRAALDITSAEREAYLDAQCSDPALRAQLDALLMVAMQTEQPLPELDVQALAPKPIVQVDRSGELIGAFRLLSPLGSGGMGAVWLAERTAGFKQQVAIKWLHAGLSESARQRFARERETLAKLEHPGIARIVDGGSDLAADWFAMEFVPGLALDAYVKSTAASLLERIKLVLSLCDAVQYAHQNLIVHRDLKPSNILVSASGQPKLLDFGVAKFLDDANQTISRAPMTFAYAAPEQIRGDAITTATDVYALGVILFELLTGERPHKPKGDGSLSLLQAITDTDATAPSAVVSLQTSRFIKPKQLKGDLDTIVLKALSRDPARRYGSAQALADDLSKFLAGLPISARPDSLAYRLKKWLRRNPVSAPAALLAVLALITLTWVSVQQAQQAISQSRRADAMSQNAALERDEVIVQLRKQEALREHFLAVLNRATASDEKIAPEQLLALAANTKLVDSAQDPQMQVPLKLALAELFLLRTDYPKTIELLDSVETALASGTALEQATAASTRIYALIQMGNIAAAEAALSKAELLPSAQQESELARNLWVNRGQIAQAKGEVVAAIAHLEKAAELAESTDTGTALERGVTVGNLAASQLSLGHYVAAQKAAERALVIWRAGGALKNVQAHTVYMLQATVLLQLGLASQAKVAFANLDVDGETPPAKSSRLIGEARTAILLGEFQRAKSLIGPVVSLMCGTTGETSMQCARAHMSAMDVQLNLDVANIGRVVNVFETLAHIQSVQRQAPSPANNTLLLLYQGLVAAHDVKNVSGVDQALHALTVRAAENDASRYSAARQGLALAMRLRSQNRPRDADKIAQFAISLEPALALPEGSVDLCLIRLWRAELGGDRARRTAALANAHMLLGSHPWLQGW